MMGIERHFLLLDVEPLMVTGQEQCLAAREELAAEAAEWRKAMALEGPDPGLPPVVDGPGHAQGSGSDRDEAARRGASPYAVSSSICAEPAPPRRRRQLPLSAGHPPRRPASVALSRGARRRSRTMWWTRRRSPTAPRSRCPWAARARQHAQRILVEEPLRGVGRAIGEEFARPRPEHFRRMRGCRRMAGRRPFGPGPPSEPAAVP